MGQVYPVTGVVSGGDTSKIGGGYDKDDNDMGACCYKIADIQTWFVVENAITSDLVKALNKWVCPAKFKSAADVAGNVD